MYFPHSLIPIPYTFVIPVTIYGYLQVAVVLVSPIVAKIGLYQMEMATFYIKIVLGVAMYFSGAGRSVWYLIFLIAD